eukprot:6275486-Prymnesium_polylepis.1
MREQPWSPRARYDARPARLARIRFLPQAQFKEPSSSVTSLGQDVCVAHTMPTVGGEPFDAKTARAELEAEGLIVAHRKLKRWNNQGFKPKGATKQVGGKTVYPHL